MVPKKWLWYATKMLSLPLTSLMVLRHWHLDYIPLGCKKLQTLALLHSNLLNWQIQKKQFTQISNVNQQNFNRQPTRFNDRSLTALSTQKGYKLTLCFASTLDSCNVGNTSASMTKIKIGLKVCNQCGWDPASHLHCEPQKIAPSIFFTISEESWFTVW